MTKGRNRLASIKKEENRKIISIIVSFKKSPNSGKE